jgi:long-chain acyl-CoA synthetase
MMTEENNGVLTFPFLFNETLRKFGKRNAYAFVGEKPVTYEEVDFEIKAIIAFLEKNNVHPGDKVAILSLNMPNWGIVYFSITFMGAVVVPILPDFSATEIANVLEHSEAKALFVSSSLVPKIDGCQSPTLGMIIAIEDFSFITTPANAHLFDRNSLPVNKYNVEEENLASIIYTSGTTGRPKGVMLTHKNISFNTFAGKKIQWIDENDRFLSVLPLSHTYENTLGLMLSMVCGACIFYIKKPPTPSVLIPALEEVKPTIMLSVPLIIEKIYFNKVKPMLKEKFVIRMLYKVGFFRKLINKAAGKKLMATFGGQIRFFGIGGAKLNSTVEKFLNEAKFPYAIGYGLTETSPLLAGANPSGSVIESTGPSIIGIDLIIKNPDKKTGEGEIWAKGPTIMKGYYKEPELTRQVLTEDGWFKTGDLGAFDSSKNLYIKGRLKNMILSSSGENIYPEEIESIINNFRFVVESLVVQQKGKLVALVHFNMEEIELKYRNLKQDMTKQLEDNIEEILYELQKYVNSQVNKFSQIQKVVLQPVPFQKTATLKIKRFLYT